MKHIVKLLFIVFLIPSVMMATEMNGKYTKSKTIKKEFNVSPNALVELRNKYGGIDIQTWNNNYVSAEIVITINGDNESIVEKRLKNISLSFKNSSKSVSIETHIEKFNNNWTFFGKHNNVNMNIFYFIKMPVSNSLNVHMDYGDIMLDRLEGKAKINCDYGKIFIGELLNNSNSINLDYSRGSTIDFIKNGKITIDFSTIDIEKAENIDLKTDFSNTYFKNVKTLLFNSDYGNITVDNARTIEGKSDYVHLKFGEIANNCIIDAEYGNIHIKKLGEDFNSVNINSQYTSIKIGVNSNNSFHLITDVDYANIKVPLEFNFTKQIEKNNFKHYEGTYNGSKSQIKIISQYGQVKIFKN